MNRSEFVSAWPSSSSEERLEDFTAWIRDSIPRHYRSHFVLEFEFASATRVISFLDPPRGHGGAHSDLDRNLFEPSTRPIDEILFIGDRIIIDAFQYIEGVEIERWKDEQKAREKQLNKLADEAQKELQKEQMKAAAEYAKWLEEQYKHEKGS